MAELRDEAGIPATVLRAAQDAESAGAAGNSTTSPATPAAPADRSKRNRGRPRKEPKPPTTLAEAGDAHAAQVAAGANDPQLTRAAVLGALGGVLSTVETVAIGRAVPLMSMDQLQAAMANGATFDPLAPSKSGLVAALDAHATAAGWYVKDTPTGIALVIAAVMYVGGLGLTAWQQNEERRATKAAQQAEEKNGEAAQGAT